MRNVLILTMICAGVWYLVKQTAIAFEKPEWWDHADIAAGAVGFVGFAYVYHPHIWNFNDPLLMLLYRSLVFGVGTMIVTMFLGLGAEDGGLLRTPEGLAPVYVRFHEQVSSIEELNSEMIEKYEHELADETLAKYTGET